MYIYFCEKCKRFESFKSKTGNFRCPDCGDEFLPLGVTVDEWNTFSNDKMLNAIDDAKKKPPIKTPNFSTHKIADIQADTGSRTDPKSARMIDNNSLDYFEGQSREYSKTKLTLIISGGCILLIILIIIGVFVFGKEYGKDTAIFTNNDKTDYYEKGQEYLEQGNFDVARECFITVGAEKEYAETIKAQCEDCINKGQFLEAYKLNEELHSFPEGYDYSLKLKSMIKEKGQAELVKQGDDLFRQGDYPGAIECFDASEIPVQDDPNYFIANWARDCIGTYRSNTGDEIEVWYNRFYIDGEEYIGQATADDPSHWTLNDGRKVYLQRVWSGDYPAVLTIENSNMYGRVSDEQFAEWSFGKAKEVKEKPSEPQIGMTDVQVTETNWGTPTKKNITTFSFGTYEQWVYPKDKYVYLENGIVTAIQKSE